MTVPDVVDTPPSATRRTVVALDERRPLGAMHAVRARSRARGGARAVLLVIASYADPDGTGARPSVTTIAEAAGIAPRSVRRHVRALEELGELVVVERGTGRRASRYTITVDDPQRFPHVDNPHRPQSGGRTPCPPRADTMSPQGGQIVPRPFIDRSVTEGPRPTPSVARCARHRDDPTPPPCRACATAREAADAADAVTRSRARREAADRLRADLEAARSRAVPATAHAAELAATRATIRTHRHPRSGTLPGENPPPRPKGRTDAVTR